MAISSATINRFLPNGQLNEGALRDAMQKVCMSTDKDGYALQEHPSNFTDTKGVFDAHSVHMLVEQGVTFYLADDKADLALISQRLGERQATEMRHKSALRAHKVGTTESAIQKVMREAKEQADAIIARENGDTAVDVEFTDVPVKEKAKAKVSITAPVETVAPVVESDDLAAFGM